MFCIWEVKTIMFVLYQVYVWRTQCRVRQEAAIRWQTVVRFAAQARSLPHLLLYLQNHHPHASTSTNSVCFTRSMKFADINCPEQSRHIRSHTSPLLQQSSHHVKWLLPLAHQKMTKEAVTVYCCVRNRQNTWLDFVNILLSISDLVQNVQKGYLWNYKSCKGGISPHCAHWCGLQLCQISHSCELSSCCKCIKILH